jgi:predicted PurR-regulated permease PerM
MLKKICYNTVMGIVTVTHFFVTFVVALFILSTLNILNQRLLHLEKLDFLEILVTVLIFIASAVVFFRSFKKTAMFVRETFFRDMSE